MGCAWAVTKDIIKKLIMDRIALKTQTTVIQWTRKVNARNVLIATFLQVEGVTVK